jgi:N utilization substance protein A
MEVVVADNQLSLAIGKKGQNVRLAAKLTSWKLDIVSEVQAATKAAEAVFNLMLIPGMTDTLAQGLFQSGFDSFQSVSDAAIDELSGLPGFDEAKAETFIKAAQELVDKYSAEGIEIPKANIEVAKMKKGSAKDDAEARLKQGLAQLNDEENKDNE